ncbi:hypothetical protein F5Y17DRAFT_423878 [Xylariaceae sp. FL0594]|nr:hypothetical protein F5Y17DRAFT_423878 [Xylariaceae sp. FL0594]
MCVYSFFKRSGLPHVAWAILIWLACRCFFQEFSPHEYLATERTFPIYEWEGVRERGGPSTWSITPGPAWFWRCKTCT